MNPKITVVNDAAVKVTIAESLSRAEVTASIAAEASARSTADSTHAGLATAHGLTANISAGLAGAASPGAGNVFATMADIGSTNNLPANIVAWQSIKAPVTFGGIPIANWGAINNSLSTVTAISGVVTERILQHGFIVGAKFYIYTADGGYVKFKVFRPNGSDFDFIGESEPITLPTVIGTMTCHFIQPIACQPGDVFGVYCPAPADLGVANGVVTTGLRYTVGDVTVTSDFATLLDNIYLTIEAVGVAPYVAFTGDSIIEGQTTWLSHFDAGPAGTLAHEPGYQLRLLTQDRILPYQNHAKGAQTFAWVLSTGIISALATGAKYIWVHCGVNDIQTGRTWAAVLSDLDAIKVLFDAANTTGSRKLMINEILPWTAGTDGNAATIRTWNTNLAAWCVANSATLVLCHDAMGQIRGSTGQLDDLITAYNDDGVHLTQAGIVALAALLNAYLA
jgi:hypothetical protein